MDISIAGLFHPRGGLWAWGWGQGVGIAGLMWLTGSRAVSVSCAYFIKGLMSNALYRDFLSRFVTSTAVGDKWQRPNHCPWHFASSREVNRAPTLVM